jgi:hypothetical protein
MLGPQQSNREEDKSFLFALTIREPSLGFTMPSELKTDFPSLHTCSIKNVEHPAKQGVRQVLDEALLP